MTGQAPLHGAVLAEDGTCIRVTYLDEEGNLRHAEWRTDEPM